MTERNLLSSERSSHLSGTLADPSDSAQPQPLREAVEMAMRRYFEFPQAWPAYGCWGGPIIGVFTWAASP